eukprot:scaffold28946_cov58-Skeletonema_marinoi.AAC.1
MDDVISDEHLQHTNEKSPQQHDPNLTLDSASSSILPPMSQSEPLPADCEADVAAVLQRYIAEGALKLMTFWTRYRSSHTQSML